MKTFILKLIFIGVCLLSVSGCSRIKRYQHNFYDDPEMISQNGDSYSFAVRIGNLINDQLSVSFEGFTGKQTLWQLTTEKATKLVLDYEITVDDGKFKLCLIDPEQQVTVLVEGAEDTQQTITLKPGVNYLAIVGYDSAGEIGLALKPNKQVQIEAVE